ncbi:MAG: DEAD/DEAH box helicase, partial [Myxococcota bacterium]|nr:DEAD/DEAH box helicase [Myxococcota bacterium]
LQVEYRGGDRLYLPVHRLGDIARYRAAGEGKSQPMLDKLGGETWTVRKQKLKDAMLRYAHELLRTQANREVADGHAYEGVSDRFREFEESFPYEETIDQAAAIADVLEDLASRKPMDRLIVGDVGFGKTEVALRAAMRVADEGRQVAILCPTTVLAYQHYESFKERFEPFGIRVALLSRFRTAAQKRAVLAGLKSGEVSVVVGTTGILGRSVSFKDLGLLVVDEEHRFGVRQKESLKRMAVNVDYLAMSATPIPRSLHMALSDLRHFSLIATPPVDRLPIRTSLARFALARVREDIVRELSRGGKVFFVHNRVATIHSVARDVEEAVPEAKVAVAHGQMEARELENVLVDFIRGRANVLVCTAIIESGVDLPNVNTILVNNADHFGMAQLYQLRGRVGRSHIRGYCTLLLEHGKRMTPVAVQRLRALQDNTALGSGFAVASADMDIRGAGDLLGAKQHGHIQAVGFETYLELLEEAIAEAQGDVHRAKLEPEVEIPGAAFLPEDYVPGVPERLSFYKRLSNARDVESVKAIAGELEDLYGSMPIEALGICRLQEIKARCRDLGIASIHWLKVRCMIALDPNSPSKDAAMKELEKRHPTRFRRLDESRVQVGFTPEEAKLPHVFLHWVFQQLEG